MYGTRCSYCEERRAAQPAAEPAPCKHAVCDAESAQDRSVEDDDSNAMDGATPNGEPPSEPAATRLRKWLKTASPEQCQRLLDRIWEGACETTCDHDSRCVLPAGHDPADRHETAHGCICYDPPPPNPGEPATKEKP
jgi:hypothetical protein